MSIPMYCIALTPECITNSITYYYKAEALNLYGKLGLSSNLSYLPHGTDYNLELINLYLTTLFQ